MSNNLSSPLNPVTTIVKGFMESTWLVSVYVVAFLACFFITLFVRPTFIFDQKKDANDNGLDEIAKWIIAKIESTPAPNMLTQLLLVGLFVFVTIGLLCICSQQGKLEPVLCSPDYFVAMSEALVPWTGIAVITHFVAAALCGKSKKPPSHSLAIFFQVLAASYFCCCLIAGWLVPIIKSVDTHQALIFSRPHGQVYLYFFAQLFILPWALSRTLIELNGFGSKRHILLVLLIASIPFLGHIYYSNAAEIKPIWSKDFYPFLFPTRESAI
jgi:hypothetical protein